MKKFPSILSIILIIGCIWYTFYSSMPRKISDFNTPSKEFSTLRALDHVKQISKTQHYLGSTTHNDVRDYIFQELKKIGLSPEIQEGFSISKKGQCAKVQNIIAKIEGRENGKALLVSSHYDSAPHSSSFGASDAGSGVATIIESIRAYLQMDKQPKNDIIICITDGEEIGLNGADYFVKNHPWAKEVGLVLNFEARGSGGNSFMLVETNGKNQKMIQHFSKANVQYPVTNSLAYSIYKMLPNDTDLTVFREQGDIEGFNFAFIDDHFDYHTANDIWQNLDLTTLQHQGSYLMPLLSYFADIDLSNLKSDKDYIYFNAPFSTMVTYPFRWIFILVFIAIALFILVLIYGKAKRRIDFIEVLKGLAALLATLIITVAITFGGWELLKIIYPSYTEIQHGFTYNGHTYILAFVLLTIGISFRIFAKIHKADNQASLVTASILLWLIISTLTACYLKGASYFILLVYFGLISLFVIIRQKRPNVFLLVLLVFPAIYILSPFIASFPVALGLKILFVAAILTSLLFGLLISVFGFYTRKKTMGIIFIGLAIMFLISAHFTSDFNEQRQKPNSLVYILNMDQNKALWASYDRILDSWTKNYINPDTNTVESDNKDLLKNKYAKNFTHINRAPLKNIRTPKIDISNDTIIRASRYLDLCIAPQRDIHRIDLFTKTLFNFESISISGTTAIDYKHTNDTIYNHFTKRRQKNLLTYYVTNNEPLELTIQFHKDSLPSFIYYESSFDLLQNELFSIPAREKNMTPKPFILNDAVIVKKSFDIKTYKVKVIDTTNTTIPLLDSPVKK